MKVVDAFCGYVAAGVLLVAPALGFGQVQRANLNINPGASGQYGGPSTGNTSYWSQTPGQNPASNPLLPSQERYEILRSGNLPSQTRFGQMEAGPLAPGGVYNYTQPLGPAAFSNAPAPPNGPMASSMNLPLGPSPAGGSGYSQLQPIDGRAESHQVMPQQVHNEYLNLDLPSTLDLPESVTNRYAPLGRGGPTPQTARTGPVANATPKAAATAPSTQPAPAQAAKK